MSLVYLPRTKQLVSTDAAVEPPSADTPQCTRNAALTLLTDCDQSNVDIGATTGDKDTPIRRTMLRSASQGSIIAISTGGLNSVIHFNSVYSHNARTYSSWFMVPTTPACTWWNRPEEDPSSGKLESTHPSRTSVKYDQVFFGVESIMRVNAASLDIRDATTSTPGTLNDLTTDLIMANNNNNNLVAFVTVCLSVRVHLNQNLSPREK